MQSKESYLRNLYYNPESGVAYSNIKIIWDEIKQDRQRDKHGNKDDSLATRSGVPKVKYEELKQFLQEQPTYTLHKTAMKKFTTRKVMVSFIDQQWQADLVEMRPLGSREPKALMQKYEDEGYRYILTVIDVFSRYAWAKPLKRKTGEEVTDKFKEIFKEAKPNKIQFDEGKEFYNKSLKKLFDENGIEYFSSYSSKKASVVERFNRTLKDRMWKYFTANETTKWVSVLADLVHGYNNTKHSTILMTPTEARDSTKSEEVWYNTYGSFLLQEFGEPKFKVGNAVRISKFKTVFSKGYLPNYTEELFKIKQIIFTKPIVYKLEDLMGEDIDGYFYEEELSYVPNPDEIEYKVEKVLKSKKVKGKKMILVKWKGYPEKFNEWIRAEATRKL